MFLLAFSGGDRGGIEIGEAQIIWQIVRITKYDQHSSIAPFVHNCWLPICVDCSQLMHNIGVPVNNFFDHPGPQHPD